MRSLAERYQAVHDRLTWLGLAWQMTFLRWLIAAHELERATISHKETRKYLTERIAEHQATLDRLEINHLPLIERRMKGQTA